MMGDHPQHVHTIFTQARLKSPGERDAFLSDACGDDARLRAEVESLLLHDEQAGDDFMRVPEPGPQLRLLDPLHEPHHRLGTTIGNYGIDDVIATGGMGTVYLAHQSQPKRNVALKVMREGITSRFAFERFQYESEILASLQHPCIAQVYEAGTHREETGILPFFAMEYVPDALTITKYAEDTSLQIPDKLQLFAQVCDAVHHGHQKGIIHRDLKPANILVDSSGHAKVIDFGVARSTDADVAVTVLRTDLGQLVGTLQYMSPEQCDAKPKDLDTRSDVYSLGVVLYELLCGQLPYDLAGAPIHEATRLIRHEEPIRPGVLHRRLRGDIETIVLKALEKDREKRYESAAALAADIRRYLNREPIEARPPSAWTRCTRWIMRHPVMAITALYLIITTAAVSAAVFTYWFYLNVPHAITLYREGAKLGPNEEEMASEARLITLDDRVLHTWGGALGSIGFATLTERSKGLGDERFAIIGYTQTATGENKGTLCVYDVDDSFEEPLWSHGVDTDDIPERYRGRNGYAPGDFGVCRGMLVDIFPEADTPRDEIVAIFDHASSLRLIRIYSMDGSLLYQVCHDGAFWQPYWMSGARLLVFVGGNASFEWPEEKTVDSQLPMNPVVVFALRPEVGHIGRRLMPSEPEGDPCNPVWYKWLCHGQRLATRETVIWGRLAEPLHSDAGHFAQLIVHVSKELRSGFGWVIDESGNEVTCQDADGNRERCTRVVGDPYKAHLRLPDGHPEKIELPDPDSFYLSSRPPNVLKIHPNAVPPVGGEGDS